VAMASILCQSDCEEKPISPSPSQLNNWIGKYAIYALES